MDANDVLAAQLEAERRRLLAVAGRIVGNATEAEDVVQEAWFRLARQEPGSIENVPGWLTTVVGRLSLDVLRARASRHEVLADDPFADLVVTEDDEALGAGPEDAAVQADSVSAALVVVLDSLNPDERLAFVLHDLFGLAFAEIAPIIDKSVDATKMAASRARRKVRGTDPLDHTPVDRAEQRRVVDAFLSAARAGDFETLLDVLRPDLEWEVRTARGVTTTGGRDDVMAALRRGDPGRVAARRVLVGGEPGILAWGPSGRPVGLMACTVEDGRMTRIVSLVDAARLSEVDLPAHP